MHGVRSGCLTRMDRGWKGSNHAGRVLEPMTMQPRAVPLLARLCLVCLFPFSALDKIVHRKQAMTQARSAPVPAPGALLNVAIAVELVAPVCIVTGRLARPAAAVLAGFCAVTALLYHPFWTHDDLMARGESQGREEFWEFLKNFGLVGGLMLVVLGRELDGVAEVVRHPLAPPAGSRGPSQLR